MFRKTLHITLWTLRSASRIRTFWIWNGVVVGLVLSLDTINFFDFEGDLSLLCDLFLSTVTLSAAVNSVLFQFLFTLRQKSQGTWDGLLCGPVNAFTIVSGLGCSVILLQGIVAVLVGTAFFTRAAFLHGSVPDHLWGSLLVRCLEIVSLSAFHLLVAVVFTDTWALILMVGGYLLGHLSEILYRSTPTAWRFALDLLYCVTPDLEAVGHRSAAGGAIPAPVLSYVAASTLFYLLAVLLVASLLLPRTVAARRR